VLEKQRQEKSQQRKQRNSDWIEVSLMFSKLFPPSAQVLSPKSSKVGDDGDVF